MIFIGFALRNPWSQRFSIIFDKAFAISKNKSIEISLYKNNCIIEGSFSITGFKQDHAGFSFDLGLFGYNLDFIFYDNRHYERN
jgi:hypothetical protein